MRSTPRGKQGPEDANEIAFRVAALATDEEAPTAAPAESKRVLSTRSAGRAGGKARASNLTPEQRSEIARRAATVRWARRQQGDTAESSGDAI